MPSSMRPPAFPLNRLRTWPSLVRAAALLLCAAASACGGPELPKFPPACPQVGILEDGADLTRFRAGGSDLTDMVVDGRITGLSNAKCSLDDLTHLRTVLSVDLEVARGPAATSRQAPVTYFVAVSKGDAILDKKDYTLNVAFPSNTDRLRLTGQQIDLVLPVANVNAGSAYRITIGFQLTPAQLAFNRRRGPR